MDRLARKLETARHALPAPVVDEAGRKVGLILSGGNIDPRILASIMVRELERVELKPGF